MLRATAHKSSKVKMVLILAFAMFLASFETAEAQSVGVIRGVNGPYDIVEANRVVYVSDSLNRRVVGVSSRNRSMIIPWSSTSESPAGIAVIATTLYVALPTSHRVMQMDMNSQVITYIDVSATSAMDPDAIEVDPQGHIFIGDSVTSHVSQISATGQEVFHYNTSSLGPLSAQDLMVDSANGLYVVDRVHNAVIKFNTSTHQELFKLTSSSFTPVLQSAFAVTGTSSVLYVFDGINDLVYYMNSSSGAQLGVFNVTNYPLNGVSGAAMDPDGDGHILLCNTNDNQVLYFPPPAVTSPSVIAPGTARLLGFPNTFSAVSVAVDATTGDVLIADSYSYALSGGLAQGKTAAISVSSSGYLISTFLDTSANSTTVNGIAVDSNSHVWTVDAKQNRVLEYNNSRSATALRNWTIPVSSSNQPRGIAVDSSSIIYIGLTSSVVKCTATGANTGTLSDLSIVNITAVALDANNNVYVSDGSRGIIVKLSSTTSQVLSTFRLNTASTSLIDVAVDSRGQVYAIDGTDNNIIVWNSAGQIISTISSASGVSQFETTSISPLGLAIGQHDQLIVADTNNQRVLTFAPISGSPNDAITTHVSFITLTLAISALMFMLN